MLASSWFNRLWRAIWWKTADVSTFPATSKAADPDIMIIFKLRMKHHETVVDCQVERPLDTLMVSWFHLDAQIYHSSLPGQRTPWHEARIDQKKYWGVDPAVVGGWLLPNFCMSFCSCKGVRQSQLETRRFQEHPSISLTSVFSERPQTEASVPKKNPDISLRPDLGWRCEAVSTRMIHGLQLLAPYCIMLSCWHMLAILPRCRNDIPAEPLSNFQSLKHPPNGRLLSSYRLYTWGHPTSRKSQRKTKHMNV